MLIPKRADGADAPLTPAQTRLWVLDQSSFGEQSAYLCWTSKRYRGVLDAGLLRAALRATVARHEALRTWIGAGPDGPIQHVVADAPDVLEEHDLSGSADPEAEARRVSAEFAARPMRLDRPPLHRALLLRLSDDDHVFVWCLHHIVCDGQSLALLEGEVFARYAGRPPSGEPVQFPDYALWAAGQPDDDGRAYWAAKLAGVPAVQGIPSDLPRPLTPSVRGAHCAARLDPELSRDLLALARRERCTPFMVFLSALMITLARHSGERDVVVGTPSSERDEAGLEDAVGFYVNSLPIRCAVSETGSFRDVLRDVRTAVFEALAHRRTPFEEIVAASDAPRDPARNPLFQTMLVMDQPPVGPGEPSLRPEPWPLVAPTARLDLTVVVALGESVELYFDYAADVLTAAEAARFRDHLVRLLRACADDPGLPLHRVPAGAVAAPGEASGGDDVVAGFLKAVERKPEAAAIVVDGRTLTYREVERGSRLLAARLAGARLVGVVLPTGADAVVTILAALRAGAAYLPLSPDDPRTPALLERAKADVVIDAQGLRHTGAEPDLPDDLAYVIFTSGSTGEPKGVMVGRSALASFTSAFVKAHGCFAPGQRILMLPPLTFDASVGDVFPALVSGAALIPHPDPASLDAASLVAYCAEYDVTAVDAPVALWRRWTDDLASGAVRVPEGWPVTSVMVGGDRVPAGAVAAWAAATGARVTLHNHYGPTEATVCATVLTTVDGGEHPGAHLPIGRPLPHARAYVLTPEGEPAAEGAPGELHLAGECVAHGYLDAPGLTAERFLPDPWHGGRMYRTGDMARWRADGTLEFLGRADRQVKIRGFRIEPGEVEAALTAHPAVRDAAVVASGERLVAYAATEAAPAELRGFVRERLPRPLVPDVFVTVPAVPRTAHAKVDLAALPPVPSAEQGYEPPEGPWEQALAKIWGKTLELPRVGRADNFFALGGSSLVGTRITAAIARELGVRVPLDELFSAADLADFARRAQGDRRSPPPDLTEPLPPEIRGPGTPSPRVPGTVLPPEIKGPGAASAVLPPETRGPGTPSARMPRTVLPPETRGPGTASARAPRKVLPPEFRGPGAASAHVPRSVLPPEIRGLGPDSAHVPRTVLLTGATGFLGAHLLADLLTRPNVTVVCPVRAATAEHAEDRVAGALRSRDLTGDPARVVALPGDLALPRFGMSDAAWRDLAGRVDVVCHNGGLVSFTEPYERLRPANVGGTIEALRLAALGGVPVHAVSTLGVFIADRYLGARVTEADIPDDPTGLPGPYEQAKWVADRLCRQARDAGVPVSVHRPARIGGHSRTGRAEPGDYFSSLLRTFAQTGCVPDLAHTEDVAPVDHVAAAIAKAVLDPGAQGRDFHYFNTATLAYPAFATALRSRGRDVALVPWARWRDEVNARLAAGAPVALAPFVGELPHDAPAFPRPDFDCARTARDLGPLPPADAELIGRYLDFLAASGALA
ncbi:thioester reductase domain-containing protein [Actinocorallia sp. A-T 12471]|uniref:non-ribosomal peptide synthetase family protein n=1 Tax=Actinocorallia sp. A-T 12471 TaxID=3089813 RepID=UPI0029D3F1CF|nr:thioester reductase domain-containing protein [Actinocorallia sp. A-T 12471]MDX6739386.1 thioester reductase domain-containing protein [Actinocorallia sp. A-T 12471]